jgi:hypothetical protein
VSTVRKTPLPRAVDSFKTLVIDSFRATLPARARPLDYASYLSLPIAQRAGDEMAVVDTVFTTSVLAWLGFNLGAGHATYNRNQPGGVLTRPDYIAHGPVGTAFVWEDKATTEDFTAEWEAQLRKYMAGRSGYAIWCNARRILALHFEASGRSEIVTDVSMVALFGPQPALPDEQARHATSMELFHVLFKRSRFFDFDGLVDAISCDEPTFLANATPLNTEAAQRQFIGGSRTALELLRLAALARIRAALAGSSTKREQEAQLMQEWDDAATQLCASLTTDARKEVEPRLAGMEPQVGMLDAADIASVDQALAALQAGVLPSQRQPLVLWKERATRINAAARSLRLESSDIDFIPNAFTVWRERQPDVALATEGVFAEQVAYVFFIRLLLTRILEDKGLLPARVASDGGFTAWRRLVATYFGVGGGELHTSSFMRLLAERVSTFYQHFFRQPLFDWFLPDDYLLVIALEFLGRYSFASIGSDLLGFTYEEYIDRVARNKKGHFLTRPPVVEYMLDIMQYDGTQVLGRRLLDPACGSGSFLVHAARRLRAALIEALCGRYGVDQVSLLDTAEHRQELAREYVSAVSSSFVGMDIDPFACYLAELNLLIQCLDDLHVLWAANQFQSIDSFKIFNIDSLDLPERVRGLTLTGGQSGLAGMPTALSGALIDPSYTVKAREGDYGEGFYYVICNPPYVQVPTRLYQSTPFFKEALSGKGNLYLLFIRLGLHYVSTGGRMVFIVPLTVLGDESATAVRRLLTLAYHRPRHLTRFYTGSVLFQGVDQAVAIFRVDNSHALPSDVLVAGGETVDDARASTVSVAQSRVLAAVPISQIWGGSWLVSPEASAYEVWEATRAVATRTMADLWGPAFEEEQGDLNATYVNPFRVAVPSSGDVVIYKGEDVVRFAPLPGEPGAWARMSSTPNLTSSAHPVAFTHELWRFLRRPNVPDDRAKAIFGVMASRVTSYLLNLFSTNNHVASSQLGRIWIPDVNRFDVLSVAAIVDDLLSRRSAIEATYRPLSAKFPDVDDRSLGVSATAVLVHSRLPSLTLEELVLRGEISFSGSGNTRLGAAMGRFLQIPAGGPLAEAVSLFVAERRDDIWSTAAGTVRLPDPALVARWLAQYRTMEANLQRDWAAFERRQHDLDEAVCDWYRFDPKHRTAIAKGLPWSRP